jgi:hypothetical protein
MLLLEVEAADQAAQVVMTEEAEEAEERSRSLF